MARSMTHGSTFTGIGGFDLGFERIGIETKWQVEIDPFCQKVLAKHWPNVQRYKDIRECGKHNLEVVDIISGGFPCQDVSGCGRRVGIEGGRSGLWNELYRITSELQPRYLVVENVRGLMRRGFGKVIGDLSAIGYDAEWEMLPASAFGAPHIRERMWIIAYPRQKQWYDTSTSSIFEGYKESCGIEKIAYGYKYRMVPNIPIRVREDWWRTQSTMARSCHGIPDRLDRVGSCGNSVIPQITEWLGRRIIEAEQKIYETQT